MCFRRVVWGTGLRLFYVDSMVALRRLTADFTRAFIRRAYPLQIPKKFSKLKLNKMNIDINTTTTTNNNNNNYTSMKLIQNGKPLNILFMSRGNLGTGRSLKNENIIIETLERAGANVILYGEERLSVQTQLEMAYYADVVRFK